MSSRDFEKTSSLRCPVCMEIFTKPKYLPCLHTVCEPCLTIYIKSMQKVVTRTENGVQLSPGFACPICKAPVPCPNNEYKPCEWAKLLPDNTMIKMMLETTTLRRKSDVCDVCKPKGETVKAESWCSECQESLCHACAKYHKTNRALRNHQVFRVDDLVIEPLLEKFSEDTACETHPERKSEVYCKDHDVLCCVVCVTTSHRKCENVLPIEECAKGIKEDEVTVRMEDQLKHMRSEYDEIIKDRSHNIDDFRQQQKKIETDVTGLRANLNQHLDILEEKLKKKVAVVQNENMSNMATDLEQLQNRQKAVINCQKVYEMCMKHGSDVKIFLEIYKLRKQQYEHECHLRNHKKNIKRVDWQFSISSAAVDFRNNISSLGDVAVKSAPYPNIETPFTSHISSSVRDSKKRESNVRLNDSLECAVATNESNAPMNEEFVGVAEARLTQTLYVNKTKIIASAFLHDGRIILAALHSGSSRISVFSPSGNIDKEIRLGSQPGGLTVLNRQEVAITLPDEQIIQFLDTNTFSLSKDMKIRGQCSKICSFDTKIVLVCGNELKMFNNTSVRTVPVEAGDIECMCLAAKDRIYFTKQNDTALHCVNTVGTEIFQYTHGDLVCPFGVESDRGRYVYVSGYKSQNLHQLTLDGRLMKIVITRGDVMSGPLFLSFDETGENFLQVWEQLYGNFMYVYEMPIGGYIQNASTD